MKFLSEQALRDQNTSDEEMVQKTLNIQFLPNSNSSSAREQKSPVWPTGSRSNNVQYRERN